MTEVPAARPRKVRLALFAAMLVTLAVLHLRVRPGEGPYGVDGGNYYQTARHVEAGHGLLTSISLYHLGLRKLPSPYSVNYPTWPWILGMTGRAIGLQNAANVLPQILYVLDLILLYFLANAVARRMLGEDGLLSARSIVDYGHLFVLLLGVNALFFQATAYPYTEAIAFAFGFAALLCVDRMPGAGETSAPLLRRALPWALLASVLVCLGFTSRSQMVVVAAGIGAALVWTALGDRRYAVAALAYGGLSAAICSVWYVRSISIPPGAQADIGGYPVWITSPTIGHFVSERLEGLRVSLTPFHPLSYFALFGASVLLVVVAALLGARALLRRETWRAALHPPAEALLVRAVALSGVAAFVSLTLYHANFWLPWLFGYRHGFPFIFLLLVAVPYLMRLAGTSTPARAAILALLLLTIGWSVQKTIALLRTPPRGYARSVKQLFGWLDAHPGTPTVLTSEPALVASYSKAVAHWTLCSEPPEQTRRMLAALPIDYVIVFSDQTRCPFVRGMAPVLEPRVQFGSGPQAIYVLAPKRPSRR